MKERIRLSKDNPPTYKTCMILGQVVPNAVIHPERFVKTVRLR